MRKVGIGIGNASNDKWFAFGAFVFVIWAVREDSYVIALMFGIGAFVAGRSFVRTCKPLSPRPIEHEWIRFLRQPPKDPEVRKLVATEFHRARGDERHAGFLVEHWHAE